MAGKTSSCIHSWTGEQAGRAGRLASSAGEQAGSLAGRTGSCIPSDAGKKPGRSGRLD